MRDKKDGSGYERRGEGSGKDRWRGNCKQDMLHKKNLFSMVGKS